MRTRLRGKVTLLFMVLGVLLAIPAVALADIVVADGDGVVGAPHSGTRNLGSVDPGATLTPSVDFYLRCDGNQHFNSDDSASIDFTSGTITDATNAVAATGSATATSLTGLTGPSSGWPADATGAPNCTASNTDTLLGSSTATIVAPKKAGTYTIALDYTVNRATGTSQQELRNNITNEPLSFTLTVNNVGPVINSFQVSNTDDGTSATEGQTKTYVISASDANEDPLTYGLVKDPISTANVNITPVTGSPGSFTVEFLTPGNLVLRGSVSDATVTTTRFKFVTVAAANTPPTTPGTPGLASRSNTPNKGTFGLTWTASNDDGKPNPPGAVTYTLQHKDADDASFSQVATGITTSSYQFGDGPDADTDADNPVEQEGTWTYRVQASDSVLTSAFSDASSEIKVDRTNPSATSATADRAPDYDGTGTDDWYKNTVTVSFTDNGDPGLPDGSDGSDGSGVNLSTLSGPVTKDTSGSHTVSDTVDDNAGNTSALGSLTVQVDATAPNLTLTCPSSPVIVGSDATASWSATDAHSGVAGASTGTIALDTDTIGSGQTATAAAGTANDNVGHDSAAKTCNYSVAGDFSGFLQPIDRHAVNTGKYGRTYPIKW
jgi:hypothetical protein